ncbi:unnamed protein product [Paramecium sonneborni]|uniref:Uncharacterized protein n=1 Tax=Paramecium sonneborni TaxID=65129 RepID=A0A8S1LWH7_9CILI|nr:unnamed protein product [Paramecium sonneborni]
MQDHKEIIQQKNQEIENLKRELDISKKNEQFMTNYAEDQVKSAQYLIKNQENDLIRLERENQGLKTYVKHLEELLQYLQGQQTNINYNNGFPSSHYISFQRSENI